MNRKQWLEERRKGIGGSDAAAILGLSPWKSAMDVWMEKMGMTEDAPDPARQFLLDLGNDLEPVIARLYERQTGAELFKPTPEIMRHPVHAFLAGTPDRLVAGAKIGVELKTENQFMDKFGDPGTDEVPRHYLVQCAHYMAVTGFPVWDVALLHGGTSFSIYTVRRDPELESEMIDQLGQWWQRHVIAGVPPDIDNSGAWNLYLQKKYPEDILPVKEADAGTLTLVSNLRTIRQIIKEYTGFEGELESRIKQVIGVHEGIQGDFGKVTWKKTKDRADIDWKAAFTALALHKGIPDSLITETLQMATAHKPGSRRFHFAPRKDWHYDGRNENAIAGGGEIARALPGDGGDSAGGAGQGAD